VRLSSKMFRQFLTCLQGIDIRIFIYSQYTFWSRLQKLSEWVYVGNKVLMKVTMKNSSFCGIISRSTLKVNWCLGGIYRKSASCWFLPSFTLRPWTWKWYFPPKSQLTLSGLHGIISYNCPLCEGSAFQYLKHWSICSFHHVNQPNSRSQWPRGLRHEPSSFSRTLGSWIRIPLKEWMSVCAFILCLYCSVCR
jgi:hypothetical protein